MHEYPSSTRPTSFDAPIYVTRPMLGKFEDYASVFREVWDSGVMTNGGAKHRKLESALTESLDVPHLKLFNNGTIALLTAFHALGLEGEVITTPFTFPATVHALAWDGITPVFCDIDPVTMCIDPTKIEALITEKTTAILGVHVYGMPCDVEAIQKIADRHKLKVVYDAAHAFKTTVRGKSIGSFGDMSMFSFHATKLFHTLEGGALTFSDPLLARKVDMLKNFGISGETEVSLVGINGKMNELQAAVGLVNLQKLPEEHHRRAAICSVYAKGLRGIKGISLFEISAHATDSLQYAVIRVGADCAVTRDELAQALNTYNVFPRKYFYPLCSEYACYAHLPSRHLKVARQAADEVLCLPFYGSLALSDVERIVDMIRFHAASKALPRGVGAAQENVAEVA